MMMISLNLLQEQKPPTCQESHVIILPSVVIISMILLQCNVIIILSWIKTVEKRDCVKWKSDFCTVLGGTFLGW